MDNNITKGTVIRTAVLWLALVNQVLTSAGKSPLNIDDTQLGEVIAVLFTVVGAVIAWWKNNSFTVEAIEADKILKDLQNN